MNGTIHKYDVFISYNWRDRESVESLARQLRDKGIIVFLDRWYLIPGRLWPEALEEALSNCRAVVVALGPQGLGAWQQREKDLALNRQAQDPKFPVIPLLLPKGEPALGFLSLNTWVDFRNGLDDAVSLSILLSAVRGEPPGPDLQDRLHATLATICPFRGLQPFREEDSPFFYGREAFTTKLIEAVRQRRFVAVVGASGSGKSSVVRAGLAPTLRESNDKNTFWDIVTMVPGDRPLQRLGAAVVSLLEPEMNETDRLAEIGKLAGHFSDGSVMLRDVIDRMLSKHLGSNRVLLVVDQWEEIYTLCRDEGLRRNFIDQLLNAMSDSRFSIVVTMRGDFYGRALEYRPLADQLQDGIINLGPMTKEELGSAIAKPAEKIGLTFESGLIQRILEDAGDEPGNLPLVEFVLSEIWERRQGGRFFHEAYESIGGLQGAIARKAEEAYSQLTPLEQEMARQVLLQLVRPGQGTSDTRRRAGLEEIGEKARSIVQKLTDARLLVSKRDPTTDKDTIEVAHEALIRSWDRLKLWLNKDREFLLWRERLRASFTEWDRTQHDTESLLRGIALSEAERWGSERHHDLIGTEANFITESIRARKLRKRRLARVIISTLAIIILITTGFPVTFLLYFFHPGSYRPQWNEPASTTSRTTPTSASWSITDLEKADGRFVGLALSGIGSRAVNFNAGVMLELQRRGFLDKVDVISAVSGGAIPAAYYALGPENGGPFTDEAAHDAFGFDFQGAWIRHWFFPQNYYLVQGSDLTRSDILVQVLNERLYHRATFADFRPHPKLLINATLLNDTTRFTFTDDRFERLGSSLAAYRVANAVYASLATPGAFDSVTLVHHAMIVPWYVHISDGSSADKFGIEAILEYLNRNITGTTLSSLFPKGCMILLVDSLSTSEQPWMANQQSMRTVTDYFINKAALDVMEGRLLDSRGSMLARLGIPFEKQNRETYGRLPINDPNQCSCDVIHLALSHLVYLPQSDDELWSRVNNIENKLWISDDEQSDIFHAAKLLVQEIPTFEQSVQCGVKSLR